MEDLKFLDSTTERVEATPSELLRGALTLTKEVTGNIADKYNNLGRRAYTKLATATAMMAGAGFMPKDFIPTDVMPNATNEVPSDILVGLTEAAALAAKGFGFDTDFILNSPQDYKRVFGGMVATGAVTGVVLLGAFACSRKVASGGHLKDLK